MEIVITKKDLMDSIENIIKEYDQIHNKTSNKFELHIGYHIPTDYLFVGIETDKFTDILFQKLKNGKEK